MKEDRLGMVITSGTVVYDKDKENLVGISIGGGAPLCPCIYVVQVFDNTLAAKDGSLTPGDEIVSVNSQSVKGMTKTQVAMRIQASKGNVKINFNKLHADKKQGVTFDIKLKTLKHRMVEQMNSSTADALGLSRAILCNDQLIKHLQEMEQTSFVYHQLMAKSKKLLKAYFDMSKVHCEFGNIFSSIASKELDTNSGNSFFVFAKVHKDFEKFGFELLRALKPMLSDLRTYLDKAVPDTRLTIKKYADVKFEYLSYCLKIEEMNDEEHSFATVREKLHRVATGNYEYRLYLKCRDLARSRFARMHKDVMEKLELLDQKHVQDIVFQLQQFMSAMVIYHQSCGRLMRSVEEIFPVNIDLPSRIFCYNKGFEQYTDPLCTEVG